MLAGSLQEKLEATRNRKRRDLFDERDKIEAQRDELIARIEKQLRQRHMLSDVFAFRWSWV